MAGKKDPSIYDDRSNIGSSDELDEYGVWVKSEPQDLSSAMPEMEELPDFDDTVELPDFDDTESPIDSTGNIEFEEIPESSDLPAGSEPTSVDKDGFTEVSMNDFLGDEGFEPGSESIDFGDLDNLPDIPGDIPDDKPAPKGAAPGNELSNQLLMKIADELSSIKKELSSLKSELSSVRSAQAGIDTHAHEKDTGGGFFDEEDDEKIALTGDELDNILNTANFTEEAGSDAGSEADLGADVDLSADVDLGGDVDLGEDLAVDTGFDNLNLDSDLGESSDLLSDQPNIIDEEADADIADISDFGDPISFDNDIDELSSAGTVENESQPHQVEEISEDFNISLDLDNEAAPAFQDDGLENLRDNGFAPTTKIEDDTSYLEEDPLASVGLEDSGEIDLSGAVIDEPDLSSEITENPVQEPSIGNITIDMDMEEQTSPDAGSAGTDDFTFETEETMEIPVMEDTLLDEDFAIADSSSQASPVE
jgi:hypothetical protein